MDVSEITKVASRKRLNVDAEKLREKVSRETAKIIKLKVAQDTAYWDLKEKLQQVEGNHERLQQNMVEVQMQHEAISGQYQDELRLRPDTLNKLSSTREICDVLEEYSERLKDTLSRCKSDQASLCDAYQKSGKFVREIKLDCERDRERNRQSLEMLNDKLTQSAEQQERLIQHLNEAKQQAFRDLAEVKESFRTVQIEKQELTTAINEMRHRVDYYQKENAKKDDNITKIQEEARKIVEEQSEKMKEMHNALIQKDKEIQEAVKSIKDLQGTVSNQEEYAGDLRRENEKLHDKLAAADTQLDAAQDERRRLADDIEKRISINSNQEEYAGDLRREKEKLHDKLAAADTQLDAAQDERRRLGDAIETHKAEKQELQDKIVNMTTEIAELEKTYVEKELAANQERDQLNAQIEQLKEDKEKIEAELDSAKQLCETRANEIEMLRENCEHIKTEMQKVETNFNDYIRENEQKLSEMQKAIDEKEKDVVSKASTIGQLMCEVGTAGETTARLEAALQKMKEDIDLEKQAAVEKEGILKRQIENIQSVVSEKESELSKQMTIILDMRNEKERLQEKIQSMQSKIDNIQKELSEPHPRAPVGETPELDDNAMAFAPTPRTALKAKPQAIMKSPVLKPQHKPKPGDGKLDSMLFSMFSDTSMDEDSNMIDRHEVNRRFEMLSRGEPLPPGPLSSLKRRKPPSGGLRHNDEEDMSLSQIKKSMKNNEPRKFFKNMRAGLKK